MSETTDTAPVPETPAPAQPGTEIATRLQRSQASLPAKIEYARELANSGLLPDAYRRQPANVLYAVEYGDMLGLPPMAAITGIHIIEGKPTASAGLISALVRRAGHKLRVGYDAGKRMGWAEIVRADDPTYTFRSEWDLERAVTAELCTIKDGKPFALDSKGRSKPWRKFFPSMTKARAITEVARDACEEALYGLHYTPEELGADVDSDGNVVGGTIILDDPASAAPDVDREWAAEALEQARVFASDDDGRAIWDEVVERRKAHQLLTVDAEQIKDAIRARWKELSEQASTAEPVDGAVVEPLAADDPWAPAVDAISTPEDAEALVADVSQQLTDGKLAEERAASIYAAISAREDEITKAAAA
jgi:hypothetical protein